MNDGFEWVPPGPDIRRWPGTPACVNADTDMFFPAVSESAARALEICGRCPVQVECLEYALSLPSHWDFGVLGGTTVRERVRLRQARRRVA